MEVAFQFAEERSKTKYESPDPEMHQQGAKLYISKKNLF